MTDKLYKFKGKLKEETFIKKIEQEPTLEEWIAYVKDALKNGKAIMIHKPKYRNGKLIK